jgi:hypothetical protein
MFVSVSVYHFIPTKLPPIDFLNDLGYSKPLLIKNMAEIDQWGMSIDIEGVK